LFSRKFSGFPEALGNHFYHYQKYRKQIKVFISRAIFFYSWRHL